MSITGNCSIAATIVQQARFAKYFGEQLLKGIERKDFARFAVGQGNARIKSNHPAWVYGHISCYTSRFHELIGHADAAKFKRPDFEALFKAGTECMDDADGTIYPAMEEILSVWRTGTEAVVAALPMVPDEVLLRENPAEGRFKEMFPTIGGAVNFLTGGHHVSHLGQVSAWRRFMGLPSAF